MPECQGIRACYEYSVHHFHDPAAAAGNHLAFLHVEDLVADLAVDIALFFRPGDGKCAFFQFHQYFLSVQAGQEKPPALLFVNVSA